MTDSNSGGGKGPQAALDELPREELLQKCKQFLQFAQKAKKAKDDAVKQMGDLRETLNKVETLKADLQNCNAEKDELETRLQSKDRQLERATQENDDILQQIDVYSNQVKEFNIENSELKKSLKLAKETISKLEKQSAKSMEYEANIICLKETEKQKSVLVEDLKQQLGKEKVINERVNNVLSEVKSEFKLLNEVKDQQNKDLEAQTKQIAELNQEINNLKMNQQKGNEDEEDKIGKNNKIEQLENNLLLLKKEKDEIVHLLQEANDNLDKVHICNSNLEKQLAVKTENEVATVEVRTKLEATNNGLKEQLNELNEEIKKRGEKLNQFENISEKLSKKSKECKDLELAMQEQTKNYDHEIEAINLKLAHVEEEIGNKNILVKKEKEKNNKARIDIEHKEKQLSEQHGIVNSLTDQLDSEKKEIEILKKKSSIAGELWEKLKVELAESTIKLEIIQIEYTQKTALLAKTEIDLSRNEEMMNEKCKEMETLVNTASDFQKERKTLEDKVCDLEKNIEDITQTKLDLEQKLINQQLTDSSNGQLTKLDKGGISESELLEYTSKLEEVQMKLTTGQATLKQKCQEIQSLQMTLTSKNEECKQFENQIINLKESMAELSKENNEGNFELSAMKEKIECMKNEFESSLEENSKKLDFTEDQLNNLKTELGESRNLLVEKEKEIEDLNYNISKSGENILAYIAAGEELKQEHESSLKILHAEKKRVEEEYDSIKLELADERITVANFTTENEELKESLSKLNVQHSEVQKEFNNMKENQACIVPPPRGTVDNDEELKREHESSLNILHAEKKRIEEEYDSIKLELADERITVANFTTENEELKASFSKLNVQHSEVQKELNTMKENQACIVPPASGTVDNDDSRSEVMSSSTVSKVDEVHRMKDLEDSFEERYSKLKQLAINLKKKVGAQAKLIAELESKKADGGNNLEEKTKEKFAALTRNFGILQADYDSTVDKVESLGQQVKTLTKDLEASVTESIASKQKAEDAIQDAANAKTELLKLTESLREKEAEASTLRVTADEERRERKQLEERVRKGEETVGKLEEKAGEAERSEETAVSLKLQIVQLDQTLEREQERADRAQEMLTGCRAQLNTVEAELTREKTEGTEVCKRVEGLQRSNEEMKEQLGEVAKMTEKEKGEVLARMGALERQVTALENQLAARQENIEGKEAEIARVSKEFENYKLRAQSVLKQNKDKVEEYEKIKKQEEIISLEKINDALEEKMKSLRLELNTSVMERDYLQDEHDRLMERHSLLLQELATKERSWRSKFEVVEAKMRKQEDDGQEELEKKQGAIEQIRQLHLQEVQSLKTSYQQEIYKLKQQIDQAENDLIRLESAVQRAEEFKRQASVEDDHKLEDPRNSLDIDQMEREAREAPEGQEFEKDSGGGSPNVNLSSPLPLEQLLAQPCKGLEESVEIGSRSNVSSSVGGADRQVAHLAALLSESEAQNSRLEKLAEVLKEEIRTYQRSEERHKHIENLEYVKNVILKFLTLTGDQERSQLIPVLATILKLKKEEIQKIKDLVKAEEEASSANDGWAGYLHSWSGTT